MNNQSENNAAKDAEEWSGRYKPRDDSIWNAALEDAALTAEKYEANMIAYEIRMRKKK